MKRRVFISLSFFLLLTQAITAQQAATWEYVHLDHHESVGYSVAGFGEKGFIAGGRQGECGGTLVIVAKDAAIRKTEDWSMNDPESMILDIEPSRFTRSYYLCGDRAFLTDVFTEAGGILTKMNSEGKILWHLNLGGEKWFEDSTFKHFDVPGPFLYLSEAMDSSIYCWSVSGLLFRFSADGALLWLKKIQLNKPEDMAAHGKGVAFLQKGRVISVNEEGNITDTLGHSILAITAIDDTTLLAIDNTGLQRHFSSGQSFSRMLSLDLSTVHKMQYGGDGRLYLAGKKKGTGEAALFGIDTSKGMVWQSILDNQDLNIKGLALNDSFLCITGYESSGGPSYRFFMKTFRKMDGKADKTGRNVSVTGVTCHRTRVESVSASLPPYLKDVYFDVSARVENRSDNVLDSVQVYFYSSRKYMCATASKARKYLSLELQPGADTLLHLGEILFYHDHLPDNEFATYERTICLYAAGPQGMTDANPSDNSYCATLGLSGLKEEASVPKEMRVWVSNGNLYMETGESNPASFNCIITDMQGRQVILPPARMAVEGRFSFRLPDNLPDGLYACRVNCGKAVYYGKFVTY